MTAARDMTDFTVIREALAWIDRLEAQLDAQRDVCGATLVEGGANCALRLGHNGVHVPLSVLWQEAGYAGGPWSQFGADAYTASWKARVERAEAERDEAHRMREHYVGVIADTARKLEAAEAELGLLAEVAAAGNEREKRLEARVAALEEALRRIRDNVGFGDYVACWCVTEGKPCHCAPPLRNIARAALAGKEGT